MSKGLLPQSLSAERAVLSAVMLRNEVYHDVAGIVCSDDFYMPCNAAVWRATVRLMERREPIDAVTLELDLRAVDELGLIKGGLEGLGKLADSSPSSWHVVSHAKIVRDIARRRRVVIVSREIAEKGMEPVESEAEFLDDAERTMLAAAESKTGGGRYVMAAEIIHDVVEKLVKDIKRKDPVVGIPTGYRELDEMIGGMQGGKLIVLAGRPSMGKSALVANIATNIGCVTDRDQQNTVEDRAERFPSITFSLEMSAAQQMERMVLSEASLNGNIARKRGIDQLGWERLTRAATRIYTSPIALDDSTSIRIAEICARARRWKRGKDFGDARLGLVAIDYLQLVGGHEKEYGTREREVAEISRSCKQLAGDLDCPVVLLAQLNRNVDARSDKRPVISDLRESGAIEQDADVVVFVYRGSQYIADKTSDDFMRCKNDAELGVAKNRGGPTGIVHLEWYAEWTRFENPRLHGSPQAVSTQWRNTA